jgi:hypothetical protein
MASVGMKTVLHAPLVDDVLSVNCYGSSPGACTAQSSPRCNRKAESSLRGTSVFEGLGIFCRDLGFRDFDAFQRCSAWFRVQIWLLFMMI